MSEHIQELVNGIYVEGCDPDKTYIVCHDCGTVEEY